MEWYMWLGIGYLACMLISSVYMLLYIYVIYPRTLHRNVGIKDVYVIRILFAILIQPIGLLIIIVDAIVGIIKDLRRIKKRGKENGKVTNG
jgi:hypothetical protein